MAEIDLGELRGDSVVLHFGGLEGGVDAQTYAASLLGFTNLVVALSHFLDPHQEIEIIVEADGGGSYRTRVRRRGRGDGGFFSGSWREVFWGVVAGLIVEALLHSLKTEPEIKVEIHTDEVVVTRGHDRYVVPRHVQNAVDNAKKHPEVQKGLEQTFIPLRRDSKVTEFGLTKNLKDAKPLVTVPSDMFSVFTERAGLIEEEPPRERERSEEARLVIVKAWLNHKKRKWTFEWNGVPVSAPIVDNDFLNKIERREYLLGAGDAIDTTVQFKQHYDSRIGTYVNDPHSFLVGKVHRIISKD